MYQKAEPPESCQSFFIVSHVILLIQIRNPTVEWPYLVIPPCKYSPTPIFKYYPYMRASRRHIHKNADQKKTQTKKKGRLPVFAQLQRDS